MRHLWRRDKKLGMTLIEVLVVVAVLSIVLSILCAMYSTVNDEWQRQDGSRECQLAISNACNRVGDYISQGVEYKILKKAGSTDNDVLAVCLPADTAYGIHVPVPDNGQLKYRKGVWVVFYLSNSTGSYNASGNILWAGSAANESDIPDHVVPDAEWSISPGGASGKITPLTSIDYHNAGLDYSAVTITAKAQSECGHTLKRMQLSKTICLRNSN